MCSFSAPSPSSPFHVPANVSSVFPACPAVRAGIITLSAIARASATNVAKRVLELLLTKFDVPSFSVFCPIFLRKNPPHLIQQTFRSSRLRAKHPESSRGWFLVVKVFFEALTLAPFAGLFIARD